MGRGVWAAVVVAIGLWPGCRCDSVGTPGRCDTPGGEPSYVAPTVLSAPADTELAVYFFEALAGDSILIDYGDVEILIDGGLADARKTLKTSGLVDDGRVELVIMTHGDLDHFAGLVRVFFGNEALEVSEVWEPGYWPGRTKTQPEDLYERWTSQLEHASIERWLRPLACFHRPLDSASAGTSANDGIAFAVVDSGDPLDALSARLKLRLLHADMAPTTENLDSDGDQNTAVFGGSEAYRINNSSVVVSLEYDGVRFLFTGDINGRSHHGDCQIGEVEAQLLERARPYLAADVLKVPHHGSDSSNHPDFVHAIAPTYAIIQPFEPLPLFDFGPPADEILEWYRGERDQCGQPRPSSLSELFITGDGIEHVRCAVVAGAVSCAPHSF